MSMLSSGTVDRDKIDSVNMFQTCTVQLLNTLACTYKVLMLGYRRARESTKVDESSNSCSVDRHISSVLERSHQL